MRAAVAASADRRGGKPRNSEYSRAGASRAPVAREQEVFERVAGQANKAVAIDLGVSERTVEIHRSRVMKKMQARNLASLVRMRLALENVDLTPNAGLRRRPA